MSALVAGFLLIGYLLAPGVIYRLAFSSYIPAKRYQRTRSEEVVFSLLVTILPFALTWLLLSTPIGHMSSLAADDSKHAYGIIFKSLLPGTDLPKDQVASSYLHAFLEQSRFLAVLWILCSVEGWISGRLVASYGDYPDDSRRRWFCDKFLLAYVSEWEILFTALSLPSSAADLQIEVDALSSMDILYRGRLVDWFLDTDGKLEGIFLEQAARYSREDLERDRAAGLNHPKESYWRPIPGAKLYLVASTIANYNIRYVAPGDAVGVLRQRLGLHQDETIVPLPRIADVPDL